MFYKISHNLDIIRDATYPITKLGIRASPEAPRYWVLAKEGPTEVIMAGPRRHQIATYDTVEEDDRVGDSDSEADTDDAQSQSMSDPVSNKLSGIVKRLQFGKKWLYGA